MGIVTETLPSGIGVVGVSGPLLSDVELEGLREAIRQYVEREEQRLLIDLREVTYLNSSAIGVLVSVHTTYSKRHWQVKFCNINKNVHLVFAVTNLDKVLAIHETREEAIAAFARHH